MNSLIVFLLLFTLQERKGIPSEYGNMLSTVKLLDADEAAQTVPDVMSKHGSDCTEPFQESGAGIGQRQDLYNDTEHVNEATTSTKEKGNKDLLLTPVDEKVLKEGSPFVQDVIEDQVNPSGQGKFGLLYCTPSLDVARNVCCYYFYFYYKSGNFY